jgi:hypothetical protein
MNIQHSDLVPRNMFVGLWLRSVVWSMIYGSALGALVIVILINSYGFLVWADIIPSTDAYDKLNSTLNAMLLYIPFEAIAGAVIGGILGVLQSVFTGFVIGRVTMTRFYPPNWEENAHSYRRIMGRLSTLGAFFITLLVLAGYIIVQMANNHSVLKLSDILIVTVIVFLITYVAWCASQRVCHWYTGIELQSTGIE